MKFNVKDTTVRIVHFVVVKAARANFLPSLFCNVSKKNHTTVACKEAGGVTESQEVKQRNPMRYCS